MELHRIKSKQDNFQLSDYDDKVKDLMEHEGKRHKNYFAVSFDVGLPAELNISMRLIGHFICENS